MTHTKMKFNNLRELTRICAQTTTQFSNSIVDNDEKVVWKAMSKIFQIQKYIASEHFKEIFNIDSDNRSAFRYELGLLKATQVCGKKYLSNKIIHTEHRIRKWG